MRERVPDWESVLHQNLEDWKHRAFDWQSWNCCDFAAAHVLAITGVDHRCRFEFRACCREDYEAFLEQHGGLVKLISGVLGEPVPLDSAECGDLICSDLTKGETMIVKTASQYCALSGRGLIDLDVEQVRWKFKAAWRV